MTRNLLLACALGALLSTTAAAQNYNGYLDVADCNQLAGWAWDSTQPNTSINVDIYDGATFVATVLASNFRQDLYNAGYGNGNHGYSFSTPASMKNNQYHYIYVKYVGTGLLLNNSDQPLYCTATSTGYQYYYSDTFASINASALTQNGALTTGSGCPTNA